MRKNVFVFLCAALLILAVVPAINLELAWRQKVEMHSLLSRPALYNFDFALPYLSQAFYRAGISIRPGQVVIGKKGWLYLGDEYEETISAKRRCGSEADRSVANKINAAMQSWSEWVEKNGAHSMHIMVGPDKSSIYPEFLPAWAVSDCPHALDVFMANVDPTLYADLRPALVAAKGGWEQPLYYQTDTHWNSLGAWVAYRAFASIVSANMPEVRWLSDQQFHIAGVAPRPGGDLSNFLRMTNLLTDTEVAMQMGEGLAVETQQYDFETRALKSSGGNPGVLAPFHPLLVKSPSALNNKKVLWLRDSFGTSLAPYMDATFSEVLQLHYGATNPEGFAALVSSFKPDYVFITVVERDSRTAWFEKMPPSNNSLN